MKVMKNNIGPRVRFALSDVVAGAWSDVVVCDSEGSLVVCLSLTHNVYLIEESACCGAYIFCQTVEKASKHTLNNKREMVTSHKSEEGLVRRRWLDVCPK